MKTVTAFQSADRYLFDFNICRPSKGWAQLDTAQDAWYYGNWINPLTLELVSYCEGDVTRKTCETDEEFREEVEKVCRWHLEHDGKRPGIDTLCLDSIEAAFRNLGLEHWLH